MRKPWSMKAAAGGALEISIMEQIGTDWFSGDGLTAKQFSDDLKAAGKVSRINLIVSSPGGSVFDGLAIANILIAHPARVSSHVIGLAASIASCIVMSSDPGQISMSEASVLMIHNPWSTVQGDSNEMRKMAETMDVVKDQMISLYKRHSSLSAKEISALLDEETWMDPQEAIENGFADRVVTECARCARSAMTGSYGFLRGTQVLLFRENLRNKFLQLEEPLLRDAGRDPTQIHPGCNLEGRFAELSASPRGPQEPFEHAQPLPTISDGANVRAGTSLLEETELDDHPFRAGAQQLPVVRPRRLEVIHIHNRNRFAGLAEQSIQSIDFAHFFTLRAFLRSRTKRSRGRRLPSMLSTAPIKRFSANSQGVTPRPRIAARTRVEVTRVCMRESSVRNFWTAMLPRIQAIGSAPRRFLRPAMRG